MSGLGVDSQCFIATKVLFVSFLCPKVKRVITNKKYHFALGLITLFKFLIQF